MVEGSAVTNLKFLLIFEPGALHLHFVFVATNYVGGLGPPTKHTATHRGSHSYSFHLSQGGRPLSERPELVSDYTLLKAENIF